LTEPARDRDVAVRRSPDCCGACNGVDGATNDCWKDCTFGGCCDAREGSRSGASGGECEFESSIAHLVGFWKHGWDQGSKMRSMSIARVSEGEGQRVRAAVYWLSISSGK
jgi:hypothetical protein